MKLRIAVFLPVTLMLLVMCVPALAIANSSTEISLSLSKTTASVGESVTASGTTAPGAWVPLKVIDGAQSILVFDAKKADANGNYRLDFVVPAGASGTLTVVAGEGGNVTTETLTVGTVPPADREAPTWPANSTLKATSVTQTGLTLTWSAASDNVGVTAYKIFKDGTVIGTVEATTFTYNVTGLSAATTYTFKVEAGDAANNWSTNGPRTTVTTKSAGGGGDGGGGDSTSSVSQPETGASKSITAATGGTVSYENLTVEIPAGALPGNATVSVSKLTPSKAKEVVPEGLQAKLCSDVYEITTTGGRDFGDKTITIKIAYDPSKIAAREAAVIQYYDEAAGKWMALETTVVQENGKWYAVTHVNHLTKFAVFSAAVKNDEVPSQPSAKVIKLTIGQVEASVDGSPYILDAAPYVDTQAGRALAPVRFISEALGAGVDWNPETRQVTITDGGKEIVLTLGSGEVRINGVKQTIDCVPAILPPGRTFAPLRFVSETLGAKVDYEAQTREITITR